jgi:hypothetical protein
MAMITIHEESAMSIEPIGERPAPRCYHRPSAKTAVQSRVQMDGSAVLLALSLATAITAFLLGYRGSLL